MAEIRINATGELKLYDSDDSNYVSFKSAGTVSSNIAWTLPSADGSSGQMLSTNGSGTLSWATASSADPSSADGDSLGTASAEWSDLFLADGGIIKFGNDQDTLLTHTDGTGLTLNSTNKLCFNDASQFVQGSSATVLSIGATDEIDLTATAVDLNGTLDVSGNSQFSGTITVGVDDTGLDVKFFGAASGSYMLWDESADDLILAGAAGLSVAGATKATGGLGVISTKDLGTGLHIRTADANGATVNANVDELVIEGSAHSGMTILSGQSSEGAIAFGDADNNKIAKIIYDHTDNEMKFEANALHGMRFTGTAGGKLWVSNDGADPTSATTSNAGVYIANNLSSFFTSYNTHPMTVHNSTSTNSGLTIIDLWRKGASIGGIDGTNTTVTYRTSSDYRLKENETAITDGIDRIKQLKPYRFNFKADADKTLDGFFAHEVSSIVPEAITGEKDDMHPEVLYTADDELPEGKNIGDVKEEAKINAQGIDHSKLVPLLTSALQEAITKIETLEAKVAVLEG